MRQLALSVLLSCAAAPAFAAPDLTTSISAPSATVYASARYTASVTNRGAHTANGATLTIQLPTTNTSPQVYVLGTVGAKSANCAASGTRLVCSIGQLKRGKSATVFFDFAAPQSAAPIVFSATAATSGETNTGNNGSSATANLTYVDTPLSGDTAALNTHCTGTGLVAFYECTLFPSSLSDHRSILHDDGSISFPDEPAYGGSWWQTADDRLEFEYTEGTFVVAEFSGRGVGGGCFEGLTRFPDGLGGYSTYVSPYEICPE